LGAFRVTRPTGAATLALVLLLGVERVIFELALVFFPKYKKKNHQQQDKGFHDQRLMNESIGIGVGLMGRRKIGSKGAVQNDF
jgi:hypothetical protein